MCKFFNRYEESLHLGVCKLAKYVRICVVFWKNLHSKQKFYTTAGRDKFQGCAKVLFRVAKMLHLVIQQWFSFYLINIGVKHSLLPSPELWNQEFDSIIPIISLLRFTIKKLMILPIAGFVSHFQTQCLGASLLIKSSQHESVSNNAKPTLVSN